MIIGGIKRGPVKHSRAAQKHYDRALALIRELKAKRTT